MSFSDKYQDDDDLTITYHHPDWKEDSYWKFAAFRTLEDMDEFGDLVKQLGEGKPTSQIVAFLSRHSRGWGGPDNTLPNTYKDKDKQPHPLRGQVPPDDEEWIKKQEVALDAMTWLTEQYGLRSKEDQKSVGESDRSVDSAGRAIGITEEVPVPASAA